MSVRCARIDIMNSLEQPPGWVAGLPLGPWALQVDQLAVTQLSLQVQMQEGWARDSLANSLIRGLLGARFRELRCLTAAPSCAGCSQRAECDYARVFEHEVLEKGEVGAHGSHQRPPFWLQGVPVTRTLSSNETLSVVLRATGPALPALPYLDVSLRDALTRALGPAARLGASRPSTVRREPLPAATRWRIEARSPLVLEGDPARCRQDCPDAPHLAALVRAGVRRLSGLIDAYGSAPRQHSSYPDLTRVRTVAGKLTWWEDSRFSHRQQRRVPLGGWVGAIEVEGEALAPLGDFFAALNLYGVGKAVVMGLGEVCISQAPGGVSDVFGG
jgi:hypothetical protein